MSTPLIEIKNLSAGYDSRTVLRNVNLTVYDRDFLGIIGPNGGGKTTLIKCILGLLKPTTGEILYSDKRSVASDKQRGTAQRPALTTNRSVLKMGYLPQYNSIDRKFPITVEEVILSGLSSQKSLISRFTATHREKSPASDCPHGIGRSGKTCYRCIEWRTIATCPTGTCHHFRSGTCCPRRTQYVYRQALRSPALRIAG